MAEVGATYPQWDAEAKRPVNVELQINDCRENNMKAAPYKFDAPEQKAQTTYIKHQAPGKPMHVALSEGQTQDWREKGEEIYDTTNGQHTLACPYCHEANTGSSLRPDYL